MPSLPSIRGWLPITLSSGTRIILEGVAGNPALFQVDGEHPNAEGVDVIVTEYATGSRRPYCACVCSAPAVKRVAVVKSTLPEPGALHPNIKYSHIGLHMEDGMPYLWHCPIG